MSCNLQTWTEAIGLHAGRDKDQHPMGEDGENATKPRGIVVKFIRYKLDKGVLSQNKLEGKENTLHGILDLNEADSYKKPTQRQNQCPLIEHIPKIEEDHSPN